MGKRKTPDNNRPEISHPRLAELRAEVESLARTATMETGGPPNARAACNVPKGRGLMPSLLQEGMQLPMLTRTMNQGGGGQQVQVMQLELSKAREANAALLHENALLRGALARAMGLTGAPMSNLWNHEHVELTPSSATMMMNEGIPPSSWATTANKLADEPLSMSMAPTNAPNGGATLPKSSPLLEAAEMKQGVVSDDGGAVATSRTSTASTEACSESMSGSGDTELDQDQEDDFFADLLSSPSLLLSPNLGYALLRGGDTNPYAQVRVRRKGDESPRVDDALGQ